MVTAHRTPWEKVWALSWVGLGATHPSTSPFSCTRPQGGGSMRISILERYREHGEEGGPLCSRGGRGPRALALRRRLCPSPRGGDRLLALIFPLPHLALSLGK